MPEVKASDEIRCIKCGSVETYIRKDGKPDWYRNNTLCSKCYHAEKKDLKSKEQIEKIIDKKIREWEKRVKKDILLLLSESLKQRAKYRL